MPACAGCIAAASLIGHLRRQAQAPHPRVPDRSPRCYARSDTADNRCRWYTHDTLAEAAGDYRCILTGTERSNPLPLFSPEFREFMVDVKIDRLRNADFRRPKSQRRLKKILKAVH